MGFEPTLQAAHARLAAVQPAAYARTRNHLEGAVTYLSPYITHGFITLPEVRAAFPDIDDEHKLVFELAWREYFHHVWQHEGDAIFDSLHEGVLPDAEYARELPPDIRQGATGVPVVDQAVRALYATGWLHNHARMWLASYVVHVRRVHWRAGADWLYGHLLDGDLASNHLSWQWVAATASHKPYLFNAANVARYAPPAWHSPGTVVDTSYEALGQMARGGRMARVAGGPGVEEPALWATPPPALALVATAPEPGSWCVHPWALRAAPNGQALAGVFVAAFHQAWPWSAQRWQFAATRMAALCRTCHWVQAALPASCAAVEDAHIRTVLAPLACTPAPRVWAAPHRRCASFSQFWAQVGPPRR